MKKIILVLLSVIAMSCMLDEQYTNRDPKPTVSSFITITKTIYVDDFGAVEYITYQDARRNPIFDQTIIDEIEASVLAGEGKYNLVVIEEVKE